MVGLKSFCSYSEFRENLLLFYWDNSQQALVRAKIHNGRYESKGKTDMADYLIELAQLARLLTLPLEDQQFLDLAIQHFPQYVRSVMIVAKPSNFGGAIMLLKQLQGQKAAEKGPEVNLGLYSGHRRNHNKNNGNSNYRGEAGAS